jgi:hypothetical protein
MSDYLEESNWEHCNQNWGLPQITLSNANQHGLTPSQPKYGWEGFSGAIIDDYQCHGAIQNHQATFQCCKYRLTPNTITIELFLAGVLVWEARLWQFLLELACRNLIYSMDLPCDTA